MIHVAFNNTKYSDCNMYIVYTLHESGGQGQPPWDRGKALKSPLYNNFLPILTLHYRKFDLNRILRYNSIIKTCIFYFLFKMFFPKMRGLWEKWSYKLKQLHLWMVDTTRGQVERKQVGAGFYLPSTCPLSWSSSIYE